MKAKKKLTPKQKEELKGKIKRLCLGALHVLSYILSILFIIVCIVAGLQSCHGKPQKVGATSDSDITLVQQRAKPKAQDLTRIFYPSDIVVDSTVNYYLNLNFSNYNYLEYFWPDPEKLDSFDKNLNTLIHTHEGQDYDFYLPLYSVNNDGQEVSGFDYLDGNMTISIHYDYLVCTFDYYDQDPYVSWSLSDEEYGLWQLFYWGQNGFVSNLDDYDIYEGEILLINLFDYVFTGNNVYFKFDEYIQRTSERTLFAKFCAYYLSNYSFDFNNYVFGGLDKYTSFTYLFKRLYNGFFIYVPNATQTELNGLVLFKGVWEYKNTIYTSIILNLKRAWNGTVQRIVNGTTYNYDYQVTYWPPESILSPTWFSDIFDGDSPALTNYYFINSIDMVGVNGQKITLAYNRFKESITTPLATASNKWTLSVYPGNNIRLFQDDSWLLNNNIEFTLYSITYDYSFALNSNIFNAYQYYADFFFAVFTYTGIYSSVKPGSNNDSSEIQVLAPVFTMLGMALTGMLPFLNVVILPGVSLGTLLALPFVVSIILFVVRLFKR